MPALRVSRIEQRQPSLTCNVSGSRLTCVSLGTAEHNESEAFISIFDLRVG